MNVIPHSVKIYCHLEIGDGNILGNNIVIGYPDRNNIKKTLSENIPMEKLKTGQVSIGSNCIIRDGGTIYERVKIGDNAFTGPSFQIREDTVIGDKCIIGTYSVIQANVIIGNHVCLQTGSFIAPNTIIKDNVIMGPNVTFLDNKFLDYKLSPSRGPIVETNVKIGGNTTILPGVVLGKNSIIGAGSVLTRDVPAGAVVAGNPARKIKENPFI